MSLLYLNPFDPLTIFIFIYVHAPTNLFERQFFLRIFMDNFYEFIYERELNTKSKIIQLERVKKGIMECFYIN